MKLFKGLKNRQESKRTLRLESLEDRNLLAVLTGSEVTITDTEYAEIANRYTDFDLPEDRTALNLIEVTANDSGLSLADLKEAIQLAGTSSKNDLIVVRTSTDAYQINYASSEDEISVNIASSVSGNLSIVGYGNKSLTLNAKEQSRVLSVASGSALNLGNITLTGGSSSQSAANIGYGGGIYNARNTQIQMMYSTVTNNYSSYNGGGISNYGSFRAVNSIFSRNTVVASAYSYGGAVYNGGTAEFINTTIVNNYAKGTAACGGGIYAWSGSQTTVTNGTIANNTSQKYGGGIDVYGSKSANYQMTLQNTILVENTAEVSGNDVYRYNTKGTLNADRALSTYTAWDNAETEGIVNYEYDPEQPLFQADYSGDYSLKKNSQAIDLGKNDYVTTTLDLGNKTRIADGKGTGEAIVDIGAFEFHREVPSLLVTTRLDVVDDSDGLTSLREAINAVAEGTVTGSTITFDPTVFTESASRTIFLQLGTLSIADSLTIDASNITGGVTINGDKKCRIFAIAGGETEETAIDVAMNKITISDGYVKSSTNQVGAGIFADNVHLTLTDCALTGNILYISGTEDVFASGGGISISGGSLNLTNTSFSKNYSFASSTSGYAYSFGGAVRAYQTDVTITDSTFNENFASYGGGLYQEEGTLTIDGSKFIGNFNSIASDAADDVEACGGALYVLKTENATVADSVFSGNYAYASSVEGDAKAFGGAICVYEGSFSLSNSLLYGNYASALEGPEESQTQTNSTGGALCAQNASLTFTNVTITGNEAFYGGGISLSNSQAEIQNTILAVNTGENGADVTYFNTATLNAYNTLSSYTDWTNKETEGVVNYVYDAEKALFTNAEEKDYTLAENSQAIDIGKNDYVTVSTDLAGNRRISNKIVDLGAYEFQVVDPDPGDLLTTAKNVVFTERAYTYTDEIGNGEYGDKDVDLFAFTVTEDDLSTYFSVATTLPEGGTGLTIALRLFNAEGEELVSAVTGESSAANFDWVPTETGTYYLGISASENVSYDPTSLDERTSGSLGNYAVSIQTKDRTPVVSVTLNNTAPTVATILTTTVDSSSATVTYQWARSENGTDWTDIANSERAWYEATAADVGCYLRVTATGYGYYMGSVSAQTLTVVPTYEKSLVVNTLTDTTDPNDGLTTLREAVAYAEEGDVVTFAEELNGQTITLSEYYLYLQKAITIDASALADGITISSENAGRHFIISAGSDETPVQFKNLTLTKGNGSYGAAVCLSQGNITLTDCVMKENTARYGGAIYAVGGTVTLNNCEISSNTATNGGGIFATGQVYLNLNQTKVKDNTSVYGGGIFAYQQVQLTMKGSEVTGNKASSESSYTYGGGIYANYYITLNIENSVVSQNTSTHGGGIYAINGVYVNFTGAEILSNEASAYGGGIFAYNQITGTIANSKINGNVTDYYGGGIYAEGNVTLQITGSTFTENSASGYGGAAELYKSSTLTFEDSVIYDNSAYLGAGFFVYSGENSVTFNNSLIYGNNASGAGGAVYNCATVTAINTTIAGNGALYYGGGIYNYGSESAAYALNLYNTVFATNTALKDGNDFYKGNDYGAAKAYNTLSSYSDWSNKEEEGVTNYIYDSTLPLFTNGTARDYTLVSNSQAINIGNNDYVDVETDLAGKTRIVNEIVDLGAYEYQGTEEKLATPTNLTLTVSGTTVTATWNTVENANLYTVQYALSENFSDAQTITAETNSAEVSSLTKGSTYYFRVMAKDTTGTYADSAYSATVSIAIPAPEKLAAPTNLALTVNETTVTANWDAVENANLYTVQYALSEDFSDAQTVTAETNSAEVSSLTKGSTYYFRVMAKDTTGTYADSAYSATVSIAIPAPEKLAAPTNLALTVNETTVTANWDAVENANLYTVQYALSEDFSDAQTVTAETNSAEVSSLTKGSTYYFRVMAKDTTAAYADSDYSATVSIAIPAPKKLAAPTELTYNTYGANRARLNWTAVTNAESYTVSYSTDGTSWLTVTTENDYAIVTGLSYATVYTYKVKASAAGYEDSDDSESVSKICCPSDINSDGKINIKDYTIFSSSYMKEDYDYRANINGKSLVNVADWTYMNANYGKTSDDAAILNPAPITELASLAEDFDLDFVDETIEDYGMNVDFDIL